MPSKADALIIIKSSVIAWSGYLEESTRTWALEKIGTES
jgi:hypothetical protein